MQSIESLVGMAEDYLSMHIHYFRAQILLHLENLYLVVGKCQRTIGARAHCNRLVKIFQVPKQDFPDTKIGYSEGREVVVGKSEIDSWKI